MENGEELVYPANMPARQFSRRFSFCYLLIMIGSGLQLPFLPLWLDYKQLTVRQIALVLAAMAASRMVSVPFTAMLADKFRNRRSLIIGFAAASFASYALLSQGNGFHQILLFAMVAATFTAPVFPLSEGFSSEGSAVIGADYGRIRLWASVSFLIGNVGGGLILLVLPKASIVYLIVAAQALSALALWMLPADPLVHTASRGFHDKNFSSLKPLLNKRYGLLILAASLGQSSHAMIYSFGSLGWTAAGYSELLIGVLWAAAVLSEIIFLYFSRPLVQRIGPTNIMALGITGGIVRWLLMLPNFGFWFSMMVQTLHALSFATLHLGIIHSLVQSVPRSSRNLAQGIYTAASSGLAMTTMTWLAGAAYAKLGSETYLLMVAVSLLALACVMVLQRISPTTPEKEAA